MKNPDTSKDSLLDDVFLEASCDDNKEGLELIYTTINEELGRILKEESIKSCNIFLTHGEKVSFEPVPGEHIILQTPHYPNYIGVIYEIDGKYAIKSINEELNYYIPEDGSKLFWGRILGDSFSTAISREHIAIYCENNRIIIQEMSRHGTQVYGKIIGEILVELVSEKILPNIDIKGHRGKLNWKKEIEFPEKLIRDKEVVLGESVDYKDEIRIYKTNLGDTVVACSNKGENYIKDKNEDRIGLNTQKGLFCVADGMGGVEDGDLAADAIVRTILKYPQEAERWSSITRKAFKKRKIDETAGACFVSAQIVEEQGEKYLYPNWAGDCDLIVLDEYGEIVFRSIQESIVSFFVKKGILTEIGATRADSRHMILNGITLSEGEIKGHFKRNPKKVLLKPSYKVLLMSDGVGDNLTITNGENNELKINEIWKIFYESAGLIEAFTRVIDTVKQRMKNYKKIFQENPEENELFSDYFVSRPKPDNYSLIIIDIK